MILSFIDFIYILSLNEYNAYSISLNECSEASVLLLFSVHISLFLIFHQHLKFHRVSIKDVVVLIIKWEKVQRVNVLSPLAKDQQTNKILNTRNNVSSGYPSTAKWVEKRGAAEFI